MLFSGAAGDVDGFGEFQVEAADGIECRLDEFFRRFDADAEMLAERIGIDAAAAGSAAELF